MSCVARRLATVAAAADAAKHSNSVSISSAERCRLGIPSLSAVAANDCITAPHANRRRKICSLNSVDLRNLSDRHRLSGSVSNISLSIMYRRYAAI